MLTRKQQHPQRHQHRQQVFHPDHRVRDTAQCNKF